MTVTLDLHARLPLALRDPAATGPFLRDFAAFWGHPILPGDGYDEGELAAAEKRLGLTLPRPLRELYLLLGHRRDLTSNHNTLRAPAELEVVDGALVYQDENQGAARWGVALADLGSDDPATVVRADLAQKSRERWEPGEVGLTVACVQLVMAETVQHRSGYCDFTEGGAADWGLSAADYPELPPVGREARWFTDREGEVLVQELDGFCLFVRARTEAALDRFREAVPAEWLEG